MVDVLFHVIQVITLLTLISRYIFYFRNLIPCGTSDNLADPYIKIYLLFQESNTSDTSDNLVLVWKKKYIKQFCSLIMFSLCILISVMTDVEFKRRLTNQLIFTFAREILRLCRTINTERCIGCQYNDSSQPHNDCLTMIDDEVVMFHLEEALQNVQHSKIPDLYEKNTEYLNIPKDMVKEVRESFNLGLVVRKQPRETAYRK